MLQPGKSPIYPCPVQKLGTFLTLAALLLVLAPTRPSLAAAAARKHRTSKVSTSHTSKAKPGARRSGAKKPLGPRAIDDQRATQIQTALIKAGYLTGEPSGHWDASSQAAMEKLQSDNGWQTKLVPDSRALIKLGLGPGVSPGQSASANTASNAVPPTTTQP